MSVRRNYRENARLLADNIVGCDSGGLRVRRHANHACLYRIPDSNFPTHPVTHSDICADGYSNTYPRAAADNRRYSRTYAFTRAPADPNLHPRPDSGHAHVAPIRADSDTAAGHANAPTFPHSHTGPNPRPNSGHAR